MTFCDDYASYCKSSMHPPGAISFPIRLRGVTLTGGFTKVTFLSKLFSTDTQVLTSFIEIIYARAHALHTTLEKMDFGLVDLHR